MVIPYWDLNEDNVQLAEYWEEDIRLSKKT